MTYLNVIEIIILLIGTIAIPTFIWAFTVAKKNQEAQRQALLKEVGGLIAEHFISLEALIKATRHKVDRLKLETKHREEINDIERAQQDARIKDIEHYLDKEKDFHIRTQPAITATTLPEPDVFDAVYDAEE